MAPRELEKRFHDAMLSLYEVWRDACGYRAIRFLQMVRRRGGPESARRLLSRPGVSKGFTALQQCGKLHLTMEAMIAETPDWWPLFSDEELRIARRRLADRGYRLGEAGDT